MYDFGMYAMTPLFQAVNLSSVKCVKLLVEVLYICTFILALSSPSIALGLLTLFQYFAKLSLVTFNSSYLP
jgi:hypothetical protein